MKRIIFIDVDGTIYKAHQDLIDKSIRKKLKEASLHADLYLSTGRCLPVLVCLGEAIDYFKGMVLSNGTLVFHDNKKISENIIPTKDIKELVKYSKELNCNIGLIDNHHIYVNDYTDVVEYALYPHREEDVIDLKGYDFDLEKEYNMAWTFDKLDKVNQLEEKIPSFKFFKWGQVGSDILTMGISKATGIKNLLDYLKKVYGEVSFKTYAIGDSGNDIDMFKLVDVAISMGNGTEQARLNATYITDNIENEGFEKAIDKIIRGEW